jgi:hypothetical protein
MIAPFWADSDIRGGNLGHVWKKTISSNVFAVAWDHVGYFSFNGDNKNTFMVMISDGNDPSMGIGNNVCFCSEDMQWTTGDWSGGVEGFGGVPATVGINEGNGTDYFQIRLGLERLELIFLTISQFASLPLESRPTFLRLHLESLKTIQLILNVMRLSVTW